MFWKRSCIENKVIVCFQSPFILLWPHFAGCCHVLHSTAQLYSKSLYVFSHHSSFSCHILQVAATSSIPQPSCTPTNGNTNVGSLKTCIARSARRNAPRKSSLPLLSSANCSRTPPDPWRPRLPVCQPAPFPWGPRSTSHPFLYKGMASPWSLRQ